jgi:acyl-[acyl carrier protein]--UDP-N-acetylglucosamine O-acyltransferase
LKHCYRIIFRSQLTLKDSIEKAREEIELLPEVLALLDFLESPSRRGITR